MCVSTCALRRMVTAAWGRNGNPVENACNLIPGLGWYRFFVFLGQQLLALCPFMASLCRLFDVFLASFLGAQSSKRANLGMGRAWGTRPGF